MKNKAFITCIYCLCVIQPSQKVGDSEECRRCKSIKREVYKLAYMKGYNKAKKENNEIQ